MKMDRSRDLYEEARKYFPGGVNSPVRAAVKPYPFYVRRGYGAYIETIDGHKLIDYVLGYGPLILGHVHPIVYEKVTAQLSDGWIYGAPHEAAIELAKKIRKHYGYDMVRFVNSGTEATVTAIRIARGYTGRKYIVKFEGCYHGANDSLLVKAGSAVSHYGISASEGIPNELSQLTYVLEYNDINGLVNFMKENGEDIAAVILEPVIANTGLILPDIEFLKTLREETEKYGSLLIFDEVVTGYRLSLGGAKQYYSINPDMITLGKIIGGGFPIGAVAADNEIMGVLTPLGKVFNAGTFNANPVSMIAGLATIEELEKEYPYRIANLGAEELAKTIRELLEEYHIDGYVSQIASMLQVFFVPKDVSQVKNAGDAKKANKELYVRLHSLLLEKGVFIPPSQFETCFLSAGHNKDVMEKTIAAYNDVFRMLRE